nr:unnamed protein product [Callosobruchus chinensis]
MINGGGGPEPQTPPLIYVGGTPSVGYQGSSLVVWVGIPLEARTEVYIILRGYLTAVRYIDEILQDFVVPYVDFIRNNFIPMHDNSRPHAARMTQQYLNDVGIDVLK